MADYIAAALDKAREGGMTPEGLRALRSRLDRLADPSAGLLPGDSLEPLDDLPTLEDLPVPDAARAREVLDRVAVVKVNGGLGTSMGLSGPKSLLEVKPGHSFLDILARQVLTARRQHRVRLPLLLMNTNATREPSLRALRRVKGLAEQCLPLDFLQEWEPKLRADDWRPVDWPGNRRLEWCPPGHGDLYTALATSGTLAALLHAGIRWAFVSNADNLAAVVDPRLASWIAAEEAPFVMEAVLGTAADRKGGHLARLDGRTVLRETAQVPEGDESFTDVARWRWYNTNNLWIDLEALREMQAADPGAPDLPLIVNHKSVDPTDPSSTAVLQLETAMGAAISAVPGARAIEVPRTRFAPVKTTADLLVVRSDAYELGPGGHLLPTVDGAVAGFAEAFDGDRPDGCWWAPGRVNLIGEHTDYNEGFVLPLALDRGVEAAVRVRSDDLLRVHSASAGPTRSVRLGEVAPGQAPGWLGYLAGVGWAMRQQGHDVPGLDVAITSTVPAGAGLSSSAALACVVAVAWNDLAGLGLDRTALAVLARRAENEIVGAPTGVMDQMASLHGRRGALMHLDTRSMRIEHVPCDFEAHGLALLVIDSRAPHVLVDGEYAERRASCDRGAARLGVRALRDIDVIDLDDALVRLDDDLLRRRVRHVVTENDRVQQVVRMLRSGRDPRAIGPVLTASHDSMRDDFEITVPQVDVAVRAALSAGAHGARMTGGGFGGCVLALVDTGARARTEEAVALAYAEMGHDPPAFFVAAPSDGAGRMPLQPSRSATQG